jgi:hypothetical protein
MLGINDCSRALSPSQESSMYWEYAAWRAVKSLPAQLRYE